MLASLFIVWSIAQAAYHLELGMVEWFVQWTRRCQTPYLQGKKYLLHPSLLWFNHLLLR